MYNSLCAAFTPGQGKGAARRGAQPGAAARPRPDRLPPGPSPLTPAAAYASSLGGAAARAAFFFSSSAAICAAK